MGGSRKRKRNEDNSSNSKSEKEAKDESSALSLFDDDASDDASEKEKNILRVNTKFAEKFQAKRRHEELSRLKDLGLDEESSSSEEEDEEGELMTAEMEERFAETLVRLQSRDKKIYDSSTRFFPDYEETIKQAEKKKNARGEKPLTLKEYETKQLLAGDYLKGSDDEEDDASRRKKNESHVEEQKRLKEEFLGKAEESDDDDTLFMKRRKSEEERKKEEEDYEAWKADEEKREKERLAKSGKLLEKYFSNRGKSEKKAKTKTATSENTDGLSKDELFLRNFLQNQGWLEKDTDRIPTYDEIVDDSDDERNVETAEQFEHMYNFRFEEEEGAEIVSYDRNIESVRRKDNKRKIQRERKKENTLMSKVRREEETKRLKNLKKQEIEERLRKLSEICGDEDVAKMFTDMDLDGDFDPDEYDRKMEAAFNDEYYEQEDADDALYGAMVEDEEVYESGRTGLVKDRLQHEPSKEEQEEIEVLKEDVEKRIGEFYKMDYEDMVGDTPVRFPYKKVKANTFGLSVTDILATEDKELNQYLSLKRLAPYRKQEWHVPQQHKQRHLGKILSKTRKNKDGSQASSSSDAQRHRRGKGGADLSLRRGEKRGTKRSARKGGSSSSGVSGANTSKLGPRKHAKE